MGLITTQLTLRNPLDQSLAPYETEALVDTGALHLWLPEHVALQLQLPTLQTREVITADGHIPRCAYVGPVELSFGNRSCYVGAIVIGNEVLLGAIPMEDLDLVVSPATRSIEPNPRSPNTPSTVVK